MNILLIGSGGREHALAWKLSQSPHVEQIYVAPGNGGTAELDKAKNLEIAASDLTNLRDFALKNQIGLTIVGPEVPLVAGIVDEFQGAGLRIFGPSKAAAQLEGSKAFAKAFMQEHDIPTGGYQVFQSHHDAMQYLMGMDKLPVIKASGLAAGKGVYVPNSFNEAQQALDDIMLDKRFGQAGEKVLIEERLEGPELSVLAFCDGKDYALMPAAQDHKRLLDGDKGPNTGGMGAFAPSLLATADLLAEVGQTIIAPTLKGMAARGTPYVGVLYAGLMLTQNGPKVLEFNCRFGDPETQVILPLLKSDLVGIFMACIEGHLAKIEPLWHNGAAATVVMASGGYPNKYQKGYRITGIAEAANLPGVIPFHAGTAHQNGHTITAGGRVLAVSGVGDSLHEALKRAYSGVEQIDFKDMFYRQDIGQRGN